MLTSAIFRNRMDDIFAFWTYELRDLQTINLVKSLLILLRESYKKFNVMGSKLTEMNA